MISFSHIGFALLIANLSVPSAYGADCQRCQVFDKLRSSFAAESSPSKKLDLALQVAAEIKNTPPKGEDLKAAIDATLDVLDDDFDSETAVQLLDLRQKAPAEFDKVFWSFAVVQQKRLYDRMNAVKSDMIRPQAVLPKVKSST